MQLVLNILCKQVALCLVLEEGPYTVVWNSQYSGFSFPAGCQNSQTNYKTKQKQEEKKEEEGRKEGRKGEDTSPVHPIWDQLMKTIFGYACSTHP